MYVLRYITNDGIIAYYSITHGFNTYIKYIEPFTSYDEAARLMDYYLSFKITHPTTYPGTFEIISYDSIIGTYFSTYTGKHLNKITIKKIIETIIYLPLAIILSPIIGFIMLRDKIFPPKYMNEYP